MFAKRSAFLIGIVLTFLTLIFFETTLANSGQEIVSSVISRDMFFELTGGSGVFRESVAGFYSVEINDPACIKFSASDLVYVGPYKEQVTLDNVVYWLNENPKEIFRPGKSLVICGERGRHEFSLHGKVTINAIEDQPAGDYRGTIYITVTPVN